MSTIQLIGSAIYALILLFIIIYLIVFLIKELKK